MTRINQHSLAHRAALALPKVVAAVALFALLPSPPAKAGEVISFTLIDADTDAPIDLHDPLADGATIELSELSATRFNVRANVAGTVGSVGFELSGSESQTQTESVAPYALFGDSSGDFNPWDPTLGPYSLVARSFTESGGGGVAGADFQINFTFDDQVSLPDDGDGSVVVFGGQPEAPTEPRRWHRTTLALSGPGAVETSSPNPFLDYRLQVRFAGPSGQIFDVPGYFAGDGEGGTSGNVWHAHLAADEVGTWQYQISFRQGVEVAVDTTGTAGTALPPFDNPTGSFEVLPSTASEVDFRAPERGLVKNRGGPYLSTANGTPWVKGGPNIPENFLGYEGFDNTPDAGHAFAAHVGDWRPGDPDWQGGAGRGIVGALNFVADRGANSIYFLPMNLFGDGRDTFPTVSESAKTRYDLSKLGQWELVFEHAQSRGIFLHFVLAETEVGNENYHDGGNLGPERKLFYRMLNARFGHHNALEWNLGEENDYGTAKREQFAAYLKAVDPYDHPLTTHTHGNAYESFYAPLLGNGDFDITSFQGNASRTTMFDLIADWRQRSSDAGMPWVVSFDEPQKIENDVDDDTAGYPHGRRDKMWPVYMGGGGGFEWYVQRDGGGHGLDQEIDDFNLMSESLAWTGLALEFLSSLPLAEMTPDRSLASSTGAGEVYTLALPAEVYAVYQDRAGGPLTLDLSAASANDFFDVQWFDPRQGGEFQLGTVSTVQGGGLAELGMAPHTLDQDWACRVLRRNDGIFADGFESGDTEAWQ